MPDQLYRRLREIAELHEWSLTETIRRAGEIFAGMYPRTPAPKGEWKLPVVDVGSKQLTDEELSEIIADDTVERHLR